MTSQSLEDQDLSSCTTNSNTKPIEKYGGVPSLGRELQQRDTRQQQLA